MIGLRHRTDHDFLGDESRNQRGRRMPVVEASRSEHGGHRIGEHAVRGIVHIVDMRETAGTGRHGNALQQP